MPTVAEIAKETYDAVAAELPDVIQGASLSRVTKGEYDPTTGAHETSEAAFPCRALFADEKAIEDAFPAYTAGPTDRVAYLEGLETIPLENDRMTIGSQRVLITRVGDIVGTGTFFVVVVRNDP